MDDQLCQQGYVEKRKAPELGPMLDARGRPRAPLFYVITPSGWTKLAEHKQQTAKSEKRKSAGRCVEQDSPHSRDGGTGPL